MRTKMRNATVSKILCGSVLTCLITVLTVISAVASIETPPIPLQPDSTGTAETTADSTKTPGTTESALPETEFQEQENTTASTNKPFVTNKTFVTSDVQSSEKPIESGAKTGCNSMLSVTTDAALILITFSTFACGKRRREKGRTFSG